MDQYKIIRGTGMMDEMDEFDMYGDGVLEGGRRRVRRSRTMPKRKTKSKATSTMTPYNRFVKRYAKEHGLSIPDAAHRIKSKKLWKGTATKGKTKKRTIKRSKTTVRRRRRNYGGADLDDLENAMELYQKDKKLIKRQDSFNKDFQKLKCNRIKNLYLNNPDDDAAEAMRGAYESCLVAEQKDISRVVHKLTDKQKNFLLKRLLHSFDPSFTYLKKTLSNLANPILIDDF